MNEPATISRAVAKPINEQTFNYSDGDFVEGVEFVAVKTGASRRMKTLLLWIWSTSHNHFVYKFFWQSVLSKNLTSILWLAHEGTYQSHAG